jgi:hypothetical protein
MIKSESQKTGIEFEQLPLWAEGSIKWAKKPPKPKKPMEVKRLDQPMHEPDFIYGKFADRLILIPMREAQELASISEAFVQSKTWGEFRSRIPAETYEEIIHGFISGDPPGAEDIFYAYDVSAYDDGGWGFDYEKMLWWVPDEVQEKYGKVVDTVHDGFMLEMDPRKASSIVRMMKKLGYVCKKDQSLVDKIFEVAPRKLWGEAGKMLYQREWEAVVQKYKRNK